MQVGGMGEANEDSPCQEKNLALQLIPKARAWVSGFEGPLQTGDRWGKAPNWGAHLWTAES